MKRSVADHRRRCHALSSERPDTKKPPGRRLFLRSDAASVRRGGAFPQEDDPGDQQHQAGERGAHEPEEHLMAMPGDANPFTTGKARYQRYMQIMEECSRVQLARLGEASD